MIFLNSVELMSFLNDVLYDKLREKAPEDIRVEIATYGLSFSSLSIDELGILHKLSVISIQAWTWNPLTKSSWSSNDISIS